MDPVPVPAIELIDVPCLRSVLGVRVPLERKDAALLALLALDGPRPRAEAAALLWPDADAAHARNSLRQRLFRLQRAAGAEIAEGSGQLRLLPGVRHDLDTVAQRLAQDADAPAGELLGAHDYADCPSLAEWVEHARERWRRRRADALAMLASHHEAQGQLALARYAERLAGSRATPSRTTATSRSTRTPTPSPTPRSVRDEHGGRERRQGQGQLQGDRPVPAGTEPVRRVRPPGRVKRT